MGKDTNIRWATDTLNFYTWNCNKVSPGCKNCYAEAMSERFPKNSAGGRFEGAPVWRNNAMKELKALKPGAVAFVNSMSDSYHEHAPLKYIHWIHNLAAYTRPDVTFLLLTKRPERALALSPHLIYPPNLWIGTSVESSDYLWRLDYLLQIPAAGHFVSAEPLLTALPGLMRYLKPQSHRVIRRVPFYAEADEYGADYYYSQPKRRLGWVIVGGESGDNRRPFNKEWAREIRDMCQRNNIPFMFKQGSARRSEQDKDLDGREWSESPFHIPKNEMVQAPVATGGQLSMFDLMGGVK